MPRRALKMNGRAVSRNGRALARAVGGSSDCCCEETLLCALPCSDVGCGVQCSIPVARSAVPQWPTDPVFRYGGRCYLIVGLWTLPPPDPSIVVRAVDGVFPDCGVCIDDCPNNQYCRCSGNFFPTTDLPFIAWTYEHRDLDCNDLRAWQPLRVSGRSQLRWAGSASPADYNFDEGQITSYEGRLANPCGVCDPRDIAYAVLSMGTSIRLDTATCGRATVGLFFDMRSVPYTCGGFGTVAGSSENRSLGFWTGGTFTRRWVYQRVDFTVYREVTFTFTVEPGGCQPVFGTGGGEGAGDGTGRVPLLDTAFGPGGML